MIHPWEYPDLVGNDLKITLEAMRDAPCLPHILKKKLNRANKRAKTNVLLEDDALDFMHRFVECVDKFVETLPWWEGLLFYGEWTKLGSYPYRSTRILITRRINGSDDYKIRFDRRSTLTPGVAHWREFIRVDIMNLTTMEMRRKFREDLGLDKGVKVYYLMEKEQR